MESAFGYKFGGLAQDDHKNRAKQSNNFFVVTHYEIYHVGKDQTITYERIVVDYLPQKANPNNLHITAGRNLIDYPGELTTHTADLTTSKSCGTLLLANEE
jgi:hypothetical protein